jgi:hypothetical protein
MNSQAVSEQRSPPPDSASPHLSPSSAEHVDGNISSTALYVPAKHLKDAVAELKRLGRSLVIQNCEEGSVIESHTTSVRGKLDGLSGDRLFIGTQGEKGRIGEHCKAVENGERLSLATSQKRSCPVNSSVNPSSVEPSPSLSFCRTAEGLHQADGMGIFTVHSLSASKTSSSTEDFLQTHTWEMRGIKLTQEVFKTFLPHFRMVSRRCCERGCEWLSGIDDTFVGDVLRILDETAGNASVIRYMLRWFKHLAYAMDLLGTGREEQDLDERTRNVLQLRGALNDNCNCVWTAADAFAERTWHHIRQCLLPALERDKNKLRQKVLDARERSNAKRRKNG